MIDNKIIKFKKKKKNKYVKVIYIVFGIVLFIFSGIISCLVVIKLVSLFITLLNSFFGLILIPIFIGIFGYKEIKKIIKKRNDRKIQMMREQLRVIKNEDVSVNLIQLEKKSKNNKYDYEYNNDRNNHLRIISTRDYLDNKVLKKVRYK